MAGQSVTLPPSPQPPHQPKRDLPHSFLPSSKIGLDVNVCGYYECGRGPEHAVHAELLPEQVDHPAHYGGGDNPYETIKVIESMGREVLDGFCRGNAIKYVMRAGKKSDPADQDLAKAKWYLVYLVDAYERNGW